MRTNFKKPVSGYKRAAAGAVGLMAAFSMFSAMPGMTASAATLLAAEFETTNDSFTGRGGATAAWTSDFYYQNGCSLFVSDRTATWHGAQRDASSILVPGNSYNVSAAVYQASGEAVDMQLSVQYTDSSGKAAYDHIDIQSVPDSEWTILSNAAYTPPTGASDLVLYVETKESLCNFYVDTVVVTGKPANVKAGDANGDLLVTAADAADMVKFLTGETTEIEDGADFNGDGEINAVDLTLLKQKLLAPKPENKVSGDWDNYQETVSPQMLQVYKDGILNMGNTTRIREKIAAAQRGETVTIGYLGGSITEGGSSTSEGKRFVNLASQYFSETFGTGGNVKFVNAGWAGTSSVVGNIRVDNDLFSQNCDIIFIEFAVNDQGDERFKKSYDSLVRKCLMQPNAPAVGLITLCQKSGSSNQEWMAQVGKHYDIPVISGTNAVMNGIKAGTLDWDRDYGSGDTIHPGDGGHKLISELIGYYYRQALRSENESGEYEIPAGDVFGSELATAKLVDVSTLPGFDAGSWTKGANNLKFKNGFTYSKNGNNPLKFKTTGKGLVLIFQSNSNGSIGTVNVTVNGKTKKVTGNLQWTWGGTDGDIGYLQATAGELDVSISMDTPGSNFVLYGVAVVE